MDALSLTSPIVLGDYSFQVGTGGFDALAPETALPVDPEATGLSTPLDVRRPLGRVVSSGSGASVALVDGKVVVSGLTGIPDRAVGKWLTLSGSASGDINGTWVINEWVSADTVVLYNPLVEADDAGPLDWEFRTKCTVPVSETATAFHVYLPFPFPELDDNDLGEVAIFARVIHSPSIPFIAGQELLLCLVHHPSMVKHDENVISHYVCVQR